MLLRRLVLIFQISWHRTELLSAQFVVISFAQPLFSQTLQMTVRDALNSAMDEEMARDDKVCYWIWSKRELSRLLS